MKDRQIEILKWLLDHRLTQAGIAREAGVSRSLVCMVLKGQRRNSAVAEVLRRHSFPMEWVEADSDAA